MKGSARIKSRRVPRHETAGITAIFSHLNFARAQQAWLPMCQYLLSLKEGRRKKNSATLEEETGGGRAGGGHHRDRGDRQDKPDSVASFAPHTTDIILFQLIDMSSVLSMLLKQGTLPRQRGG